MVGVARHDAYSLTKRERQVLELMTEGFNNSAISDQLMLSKHNVEALVRSLFAKMGLGPESQYSRRVQAVLMAKEGTNFW